MTKEVYRVRFSNGQEHDWHNTPDKLRREDPGAVILARRVENAQREGVYVPYVEEEGAEKAAKRSGKKAAKQEAGDDVESALPATKEGADATTDEGAALEETP